MSAYVAGSVNKRIIALFDVDGTLTKPRLEVEPEVREPPRPKEERQPAGLRTKERRTAEPRPPAGWRETLGQPGVYSA